MTSVTRGVSQRVLHLVDGIALFWIALWLVMGAATGVEIWRLSRLSDTAEVSARAVDRAGEALQSLGELPLVGDTPGELGEDVRTAAGDIESSAAQTRADVRRLSIILGLSVFAIPVSPVLGLYVPLRLARRAEVESIKRSLRSTRDDGALERYLARRAVHHLSFAELLTVTPDPVRDLEGGRHNQLAAAELRRLGIDPPSHLRMTAARRR